MSRDNSAGSGPPEWPTMALEAAPNDLFGDNKERTHVQHPLPLQSRVTTLLYRSSPLGAIRMHPYRVKSDFDLPLIRGI